MISKPKGTVDFIKTDSEYYKYISDVFDAYCEKYNYKYIRTPIFESSELFHRGVGDSSDIVRKETYDFKDRGDRNITLRPEGTAGVVRSFIENKMYADVIQPVKLYYNGTMYRYERPQNGRLREFTQIGVEVFGSNDPLIDAEVISLPINIYNSLGIENIVVKINSLGDNESRENYKKALKEYLKPHLNDLCSDCKERFEKNPLRILDCKVDKDGDILKNAPKISEYLSKESKEHLEKVLEYLDLLEINYEIDENLVRGLDYYTDTVFEIEVNSNELGSSKVIGAGGRYNNLVNSLGGPETSAVGFALGVDRIISVLKLKEINIPIRNEIDAYIMYVNETEKEKAIYLNQILRLNGFSSEINSLNKNLKAQFKEADRYKAKYLIILNSEDFKKSLITIKDNVTKEELKIKELDLVEYLDTHI